MPIGPLDLANTTAATPQAGHQTLHGRASGLGVIAARDSGGNEWDLGFNPSAKLTSLVSTTASSAVITPVTFTIPANTIVAGTCYRCLLSARVDRGATATATNFVQILQVGGATFWTSSPGDSLLATAGAALYAWYDLYLTFLGTGAAAPVTLHGMQQSQQTTTPGASVVPAFREFIPAINGTINTTAAIVVNLQYQMTVGVAAVVSTPVAGFIHRMAG